MPKPFRQLSRDEFVTALEQFPFGENRLINAVHMHHTFHPDHSEWKGVSSIEAMQRFHMETRGFSDLAQHITIDPNGSIWTGRNWNQQPASASGHNGNAQRYPFMFEMIGNFDIGHDEFDGEQKESALEVIARVQMLFGLPAETLRFHNQMSAKTCPGTSIKYDEILELVRERRIEIEAQVVERFRTPRAPRPFPSTERETLRIFEGTRRDLSLLPEPADAEPNEESMGDSEIAALLLREPAVLPAPLSPDQTRDTERKLPPEELAALRPHVINLTQGQFSSEGDFQTGKEDVEAIFGEHIPNWRNTHPGILKLLFYAHGGLISESAGLRIAQKHVDWWKKNGIYPIYFVWESGLLETLGHIISGARALTRDIWDYTTDPLIEELGRMAGGMTVWSGMKRSAELSVRPSDGGAYFTARQLKNYCKANENEVELFAVGHSAGSIFHSHFIPAALAMNVPDFKSVHFLAPAVRVDTFKQLLLPKVGAGVDQLTLFTMTKDWEKADHCAHVYHKSLLYLVHHAFEPEKKTPILGLEESLRADGDLKKLFGLGGSGAGKGTVVWSVSAADSGFSASRSSSHGGFDDDKYTMNSVARRVLDNENGATVEFPEARDRARDFAAWTEFQSWERPLPESTDWEATRKKRPKKPAGKPAPAVPGTPGGVRRALCVGINDYPKAPLAGCIADAESWKSTLEGIGFSTTLLTDRQATRANILAALENLVVRSRSGDVLVFQFAGHGTRTRDLNGDEAAGDTPGQDEAFCPFDYDTGALLIDDDVGEVFNKLPEGVNFTCFIDCCHSGTITRLGVGVSSTSSDGGPERRARFLPMTPELEEAHIRFRQSRGISRAAGSGGPEQMREVLFSACRSFEVAYESGGHGDFTIRATRVLRQGIANTSNEQFQERVSAAFGASPRQHPNLTCAPDWRNRSLLQPLGNHSAPASTPDAPLDRERPAVSAIAQGFRLVADLLEKENLDG